MKIIKKLLGGIIPGKHFFHSEVGTAIYYGKGSAFYTIFSGHQQHWTVDLVKCGKSHWIGKCHYYCKGKGMYDDVVIKIYHDEFFAVSPCGIPSIHHIKSYTDRIDIESDSELDFST